MAIASQDTFTLDEFVAELDQAVEKRETLPIARDMQDEILGILYEGIAANFASGSDATGRAWAPHAPSTIARHGPHPLLILSGAMWEGSTSSGGPGAVLEVEDRQLFVGNSLEYAAYQQHGTSKIPPRPFFEVGEEYWDRLEESVADYVIHEMIG